MNTDRFFTPEVTWVHELILRGRTLDGCHYLVCDQFTPEEVNSFCQQLPRHRARRVKRLLRKMARPVWASTRSGVCSHAEVAGDDLIEVIQPGLTYLQAEENWTSILYS
jgi:hypothetical protein